jgi:hypothetical protein
MDFIPPVTLSSTYMSPHSMSMSAPAIGIAAGSLAGLIVNFLVSKRQAYIQEPGAPEKRR